MSRLTEYIESLSFQKVRRPKYTDKDFSFYQSSSSLWCLLVVAPRQHLIKFCLQEDKLTTHPPLNVSNVWLPEQLLYFKKVKQRYDSPLSRFPMINGMHFVSGEKLVTPYLPNLSMTESNYFPHNAVCYDHYSSPIPSGSFFSQALYHYNLFYDSIFNPDYGYSAWAHTEDEVKYHYEDDVDSPEEDSPVQYDANHLEYHHFFWKNSKEFVTSDYSIHYHSQIATFSFSALEKIL